MTFVSPSTHQNFLVTTPPCQEQGLLRRSPKERSLGDSFAWAPSKPSVKYVSSRVLVAVKHKATVETDMGSHAEVFVLPLLATSATDLAGFLWIDFYDSDTGPFCLVFHQFNEAFPSSVSNRRI